jgi:cell surface protein SprA
LFGFKTQLQFGRTTITGILSQQKSTKSEIEVSGGAQTSEFDVYADEYEANKHYFLAHYFKEKYDTALTNLPFINSGVNITKIEVWVTNKTGTTNDTRNIAAFLDLGETGPNHDNDYEEENIWNDDFTASKGGIYPDNNTANNMFEKIQLLFPNGVSITDINNTSLTPLENGADFEKLERARKLSASELRAKWPDIVAEAKRRNESNNST